MHVRALIVVEVFLVAGTYAQSRRWFSSEMNCWITQQKVSALWEDAQRRCETDGAVLASPLNLPLFNYMQSLINVNNHSSAYFIGTRAKHSDDGQEVLYVSVEGRRLDEMPSAVFDEIDQLDLEQGDCLSMDRDGIRAVSCLDHLPYICYSNETEECGSELVLATSQTAPTSEHTTLPSTPTISLRTSTTTTNSPLPPSKIPSGYTHKSATGSSYKFHKESDLTWHQANATCGSEGAHVVVLNDANEAEVIQEVIKDAFGSANYHIWTGLRNSRAGWHTVTGEPLSKVFNVWDSGYPRNSEALACSFFSGHYKELLDYPCTNRHVNLYFVCEISH